MTMSNLTMLQKVHEKWNELTTKAEQLRLAADSELPRDSIYLFSLHMHYDTIRISAWDRTIGLANTARFSCTEDSITLFSKGGYGDKELLRMLTILTLWSLR